MHRELRPADDRGYTLIEMLVVMAIFGLAMSLVMSAVIKTQQVTSKVQASADAESEVRQALAVIDRQVRSGNVLYSPDNEPAELPSCTANGANAGTCMRVYTQANGTERCVQWQVTDDPDHVGSRLLRMRSWSPSWQTDGNVSTWSTVARGLATSSTEPFTLQTASDYDSRLLDVHIEALDARRPGQSVPIEASLSGRNTSYGYDPGLCSPEPAG